MAIFITDKSIETVLW